VYERHHYLTRVENASESLRIDLGTSIAATAGAMLGTKIVERASLLRLINVDPGTISDGESAAWQAAGVIAPVALASGLAYVVADDDEKRAASLGAGIGASLGELSTWGLSQVVTENNLVPLVLLSDILKIGLTFGTTLFAVRRDD